MKVTGYGGMWVINGVIFKEILLETAHLSSLIPCILFLNVLLMHG
ncbi:hypothetical protein Ahy_B09g095718 isoform F [Arachis hypogaea]|uniref:Uncharacterized protein n=1 Tax=Arachis hypogaea TaxID=3818 RepID=A0A444XFU0_ARAHY|nr:hypothetical protein Ahy_B09g095718 isoform F [Arachis hypogaea]